MKVKAIHGVFVAIFVVVLVVLFSGAGIAKLENIENFEGEMTLYKSQSCGCCGLWYSYFQNQGNSKIKLTTFEDVLEMDDLKDSLGIPLDMQTCHTAVIGDYFIEGHIPLEVIEELLILQPDIKGIALPGMPMGSPGMPGKKTEEFVIYQINHDGTTEVFMRY